MRAALPQHRDVKVAVSAALRFVARLPCASRIALYNRESPFELSSILLPNLAVWNKNNLQITDSDKAYGYRFDESRRRCVARGVEFGRERKMHLQGQNTPHATRARHTRTRHIMSHSTRLPNTYMPHIVPMQRTDSYYWFMLGTRNRTPSSGLAGPISPNRRREEAEALLARTDRSQTGRSPGHLRTVRESNATRLGSFRGSP